MSARLGELLIKAGLITSSELEEALNSQIFFGGKLGTNLIEMGCLTEEEIASFLEKVTGLPAVKPSKLKAVPQDIIKLIPEAIAAKHHIIPLELNGKRLTVAMTDPSDLPAIDEISFVTGFIIIPMIASEMTINRSLEHYYNVRRKVRAHHIRGESRHRKKRDEPPGGVEELPENVGQGLAEPDFGGFPSLDDFEGFHVHEDPPVPAPAYVPPPPQKTEEEQQPKEGAAEKVEPAPPAEASEQRADDIMAVATKLAEVNDRDEVANILIQYAAELFDRAAVFVVKGEVACGWKGRVKESPIRDFAETAIPLDSPSILLQTIEEKSFYLGPITDTPRNRMMISCLGGGKPPLALLIPLILGKRVVAVFYVEGSVASLGQNLMDLQKCATKAAMALEILILKNKILMT